MKYQFSVKSKEELDKLTHEELLKYVKNLTDNLVQEKPPKNSNNSSIPSSVEIINPQAKKNQSLREKSNKPVGAQLGRKGVTLLQSATPNKIIALEYSIQHCKKCGLDISSIIATLKERRQVVDLELSSIETTITEYQSFSKKCSQCGYTNHDNSFSTSITPNVSYGVTITAMVSYLSVSQYMSNKRIVALLNSLFNLTVHTHQLGHPHA